MVDEQAQAPGTGDSGSDESRTGQAAPAEQPDAEQPDAEQPDAEQPDAEQEDEPAMTQVTLRRAPRYRAFVLSGIALGLVAAVVLAVVFPVAAGASQNTVLLYLALPLSMVGGLAGAGLALVVDRRR